MKLPQRRKFGGGDGGVNITPLCDVMLSLLIFFMLVSRAGLDTGADEAMNLPVVVQAAEEDLEEADLANMVVVNAYAFTGTDVTTVTTLDRVTGELLTLQIGNGRDEFTPWLVAERGDNDALKLVVRSDRSVEYRYLTPILLAAAEARVASVNTAVSTGEE